MFTVVYPLLYLYSTCERIYLRCFFKKKKVNKYLAKITKQCMDFAGAKSLINAIRYKWKALCVYVD